MTQAQKITSWIKAHPLFKWGGMCVQIGIDKGNFAKTLQDGGPVIKPEIAAKIEAVLVDYGYLTEAGIVGVVKPYMEQTSDAFMKLQAIDKKGVVKVAIAAAAGKPVRVNIKKENHSAYLESRRKLKSGGK